MNIIRALFCIVLAACLFYTDSNAQHPLDKFLHGNLEMKMIGSDVDGLDNPVDLDFCRIPGRTNELWVLNREFGSSSMTIFFHAGSPTQKSQYRKDSHSDHFMVYSSAMAMGTNGNFATTQEVLNSVGGTTSTFMGPVLWSSDTSIYARMYQSEWENGKPLGSHIDMLHQSPYSMGIAADKDNIYWVFDGYHGNLVKYDFATPHTIGGDDHSDGRVWRYPEVVLERIPDLPAHMVLDNATGWLYIVDNANARIIRVNTKSGVKAKELQPVDEPLDLYWEMKNVEQQVYIDTGLTSPVGIDFWNGRLVVTDNAKGTIRLYDATGAKGTLLGSIALNAPSIMGVKIGPDSNLWFVDATNNTITQLSPAEVKTPSVPTLISPPDLASAITDTVTLVWGASQDATYYQLQLSKQNDFTTLDLVVDSTVALSQVVSALAPSTKYFWRVHAFNELTNSNWSPAWSFTTASSSVRGEQADFAVHIFPNPMHSVTTVECILQDQQPLSYELINILGVSVLQGISQSNTFTIDRSGMQAGSYILKIRTGNLEITRTLLITQ
jgi:hypothetical protein